MTRLGTDRLLVAVAASVAGTVLATLAGLPQAALLVAPWIVVLVLGLSNTQRQTLHAQVDVDAERLLVGDPLTITTTVSHGGGIARATPRPSEGFWPGNPTKHEHEYSVADVLSTRRSTVLRTSPPAAEWGTFDIDRVSLEVVEPFGLFRLAGDARIQARVRVHPSPTELRNLLVPRLVRRTVGQHPSRANDSGVEYADVREFQAGDTLRDINWRVSARSPELWVSQRHPDRASDVILLVDSFVESGHDARSVLGLSITAARALAESHLALSDRVGLVELGGRVRWVVARSGALQLQHLTDALLDTRLFANPARSVVPALSPRALPPRSFVVAMSPLLDRRFIDALLTLRGRGHDVAVLECHPLNEAAGSSDRLGSRRRAEERPETRLALRLWEAERQLRRDRFLGQGIAVAEWRDGEPLDDALRELLRRRSSARTLGRR